MSANKLAACLNIISEVSSVYAWQGDIEQGDELLLIAKIRTALFDRLAATLKRMHPYGVPEVIAVPIVAGSNEYLARIDAETTWCCDQHVNLPRIIVLQHSLLISTAIWATLMVLSGTFLPVR